MAATRAGWFETKPAPSSQVASHPFWHAPPCHLTSSCFATKASRSATSVMSAAAGRRWRCPLSISSLLWKSSQPSRMDHSMSQDSCGVQVRQLAIKTATARMRLRIRLACHHLHNLLMC